MHIGTWPGAVLRSANINLRLSGQDLGGGRSLSGSEQTISTDAGFWKLDIGGVVLKGRPEVMLWRALEGALDGRSNTIDIVICDVTRGRVGGEAVPHSDGTTFSDGSMYVGGSPVTTAASATLRAGLLVLDTAGAYELIGGETLSIDHGGDIGPRLYRIRQITNVDGDTVTVRITPPLRAAVASGESVEFARPKGRFKLAEAEGMAAELDLKRRAQPSVGFVEAI
ncbi:MAG: hypothetical protein J0H11_15000 [Rhizobiales bacterium]|nr:hypothetical protein [Hyphomicrobiales bacterium]